MTSPVCGTVQSLKTIYSHMWECTAMPCAHGVSTETTNVVEKKVKWTFLKGKSLRCPKRHKAGTLLLCLCTCIRIVLLYQNNIKLWGMCSTPRKIRITQTLSHFVIRFSKHSFLSPGLSINIHTVPKSTEIKTGLNFDFEEKKNINFILGKITPIETRVDLWSQSRKREWRVLILFGRKNLEGGGLNFDTTRVWSSVSQ